MSQELPPFRLTVLNPAGRDPEQTFTEASSPDARVHPPTNFHAFAACTGGVFHRETARALAEETPVLVLLRGDFKASAQAVAELRAAGRTVAISLKETGLHQIAEQLRGPRRLARFIDVVRAADGAVGTTPESAEFFAAVRGANERTEFIPTPYPVEDPAWNFARPLAERSGIFVGTREWDVLSRNHLAALILSKQLSDQTNERVTVFEFSGRKGRERLRALGFRDDQLRVLEKRLAYPDYLREIAAHKIILQLDTSFVPGQVAGDALLAGVPCVGGNGAIERLAFPDLCAHGRALDELRALALRLLREPEFHTAQTHQAQARAQERISFPVVAEQLAAFFAGCAPHAEAPIASK